MEKIDSNIGSLSEEERELIRSLRNQKAEENGLRVDSSLKSTVDTSSLTEGTVWIQNMSPALSRFVDSKLGSFMLEPYGKTNSIQQISVDFTRNPFLIRAEKRNRIRWVEDKEAREILDRVESVQEVGPANRLMEYLEEGASDKAGKRFITDLPEDAEQRKSISSTEIWSDQQSPSTAKKIKEKSKNTTDAGPLSPASVLTERVKEGDWEPQTTI
jgi:hypothetical protein